MVLMYKPKNKSTIIGYLLILVAQIPIELPLILSSNLYKTLV